MQQPKLEDPAAYVNRGNVYYQKGQYDQAISDYSKAIELNPRFAEAYDNRGGPIDSKVFMTKPYLIATRL